MNSLNLPPKQKRKDVINDFDERLATLEACVFAAMFMLEEHSGKETPISFALWQNFEHLKDSYQTLKQANAA
ncbi:MAG: hypothetical protein CL664_13500 [Balneola sp.]|nr:hypothetical protein [Balneola sp.]|tara:strand:+ start:2582 stop:2797 length:216 start_codon:yes stop_codon:yes gene_type:complete